MGTRYPYVSVDQKKNKPDNGFLSLLFNIVLPVLILTKLSDPERLGPIWALVVALIFPLSYGAVELFKKRKWNFISVLGLISVLLTGGVALLKLDGFWLAVKEAAVPAIIGIFVLKSEKMKTFMINQLFLNPSLLDLTEFNRSLEDQEIKKKIDRLIDKVILWISASFMLSAVLNFVLARWIVVSPAGTPEFNHELGQMTALSFPVIMVPSMIILFMALRMLFKGVKDIAGIDLFHQISNKDS